MDSLIEKLREKLKSQQITPISIHPVKEPAEKNEQTERFIVTTTGKFLVYSNQCNPIYRFSWNDMTGAKFKSKSLFLKFSASSVSFDSPEATKIGSDIVQCVRAMLSDDELQAKGMIPFENYSSKPSHASIISRLTNELEAYSKIDPDSVIEIINDLILFRKSTINFNKLINNKEAIPAVLNTLPIAPFINTLIIPSFEDFDIYQYFADFIGKNTTITRMAIEAPLNPKFKKFAHNFEISSSNFMTNLILTGSKFTQSDLTDIASFLTAKKTPALTFSNSFTKENINDFVSTIFTPTIAEKLKTICVTGELHIPLSDFFAPFKMLTNIVLTNCNLDICDVLKNIERFPIVSIDLSNNKCSSNISSLSSLSHTMYSMKLQYITWEENSLTGFMNFLSKNIKKRIELDISHASAQIDDWMSLFMGLGKLGLTKLTELIWDSNPTNILLFQFLKKNKKLSSLSFNNCFSENEPEVITAFSNYISEATNITKLSLSGNSVRFIGKFLSPLLTALQINSKVEYLDISNSHSGDIGVSHLKYLINISSLKTVIFDGFFPSSATNYVTFLDLLIEKQKSSGVKFSWPSMDLDYLLSMHKLRHAKFFMLKKQAADEDGFLFEVEKSNKTERYGNPHPLQITLNTCI